jgi:ABC-type xylose transport system permease subunit
MTQTQQSARADARTSHDAIPYTAGFAGAMIGGILWALVAGVFDLELGWIAWGIGGLVGLLMTKTSAVRGKKVATVAAACAVLGLVVGKSLLHEFVMKPAVIASLAEQEEAATYVAVYRMRGQGSFSPTVQAELDALAEQDTLPDALWAQMMEEAQVAVDSMPEPTRDSLALAYGELSLASVTWLEQARWHFSAFDILWFLLAVSTAWSMLAKPAEEQTETLE